MGLDQLVKVLAAMLEVAIRSKLAQAGASIDRLARPPRAAATARQALAAPVPTPAARGSGPAPALGGRARSGSATQRSATRAASSANPLPFSDPPRSPTPPAKERRAADAAATLVAFESFT